MAQRKVNEICQDENQQSKGLLNETVKTKKKKIINCRRMEFSLNVKEFSCRLQLRPQ